MSNIYLNEPPTSGKVILKTSFGDIDIELWAREAPLACRNFIQLALEGYYDNTIFHRTIKSFMVQGGDPTGTGNGGESIYGHAFRDEIHSRIKFNHRGQLAMANENAPNTNHSQFFISLDRCEWLDKKHTIFGKVTGNTIFNAIRMGDVDTGDNDRPVDPPILHTIEVLLNPFDDIVPRDLLRKQKADNSQNLENAAQVKKKKRKAIKDYKLLSFGDEAKIDDEIIDEQSKNGKKRIEFEELENAPVEEIKTTKKQKLNNSESENDNQTYSNESDGFDDDVLKEDLKERIHNISKQKLNSNDAEDFSSRMLNKIKSQQQKFKKKSSKKKSDSHEKNKDTSSVDSELDEDKQKQNNIKEKSEEYRRLKDELKASKRAINVLTGKEAEKHSDQIATREMLTPLQQKRQNYLKQKKDLGSRQDEILTKLNRFKSSLQSKRTVTKPVENTTNETYHGQILESKSDDEHDVDNDWFVGKLKFTKHIDDKLRVGEKNA